MIKYQSGLLGRGRRDGLLRTLLYRRNAPNVLGRGDRGTRRVHAIVTNCINAKTRHPADITGCKDR